MAGGEEAAAVMVKGFYMKSHQISRGASWKNRDLVQVCVQNDHSGCGVESERVGQTCRPWEE